jgi:hypothetical protein
VVTLLSYRRIRMDTLTAAPMNTGPTDLAPVVARYLDELQAHQARFLDAVSQARGVLGADAGQLAQLSAIQGRLTRQFFDAQRLILQRRAQVDAEVARIGVETEEHANVVLASAVAHAAADRFGPLGAADSAGDLDPDSPDSAAFVEQSTRQAIAALGVLAVRTKADADALEQIINDALAPSEADGARMERELQSLLDEWWNAQTQEGRALIDDARARAAMRLHVAHIEACEIVGAAAPAVALAQPDASPNVLPSSVLAAIDLAAPGGLDAVLTAVAGSLTVAPPAMLTRPATVPSAVPVLPTLAPMPARRAEVQVAPVDQFHRFWQHEAPTGPESTSSLHSILWRVIVPIGAVTSLLAVVMAWIG